MFLPPGKPAPVTSCFAAVAIGATNDALGDLVGDCFQRVAATRQFGYVFAFVRGVPMIELQDSGIAFATIDAGVGGEVFPDELPRFLPAVLAVTIDVGPILLFTPVVAVLIEAPHAVATVLLACAEELIVKGKIVQRFELLAMGTTFSLVHLTPQKQKKPLP